MIGEIIGQHYEVTELLGAGSMGEVYKGWDRSLGRPVAIKVLKPDVGSGTERFRTEAKILASLNHGNICQVFSLLEHRGRDVMVLQHLDGTPLDAVLSRQGPLPWSEVRAIAADVLAGLTEAHHAKVVHRDLKPANLMRVSTATGFKTVIMDFGIARTQGQARATREGMVACTIEYASPEQIQGEEVGPASDLYSLAMVIYELLTGELAFAAKTDAAWAHAHVYESPDWNKIAAVGSKQVTQFLRGALEKQVQSRYASAHAMLLALQKLPDSAQDEGAVARMVSSLSQTFGNVKTPTLPRPTSSTQKKAALTSQPKQADFHSPVQSPSLAANTAWMAVLKEHWALVFLGLMVLLALGFVGLSKFGGPAPSSESPTPPQAVGNSPRSEPAANPGGSSSGPGSAGISSQVPATASLDLGPPTVIAPVTSGAEVPEGNEPAPARSNPSPRSRPRETKID